MLAPVKAKGPLLVAVVGMAVGVAEVPTADTVAGTVVLADAAVVVVVQPGTVTPV
jgi:hypothetical protein